MEELWKEIEGYIGKYEVSNLGKVRSLNYKKSGLSQELKFELNSKGYYAVDLCKDGKRKKHKVARLVASAFVANIHGLPEVNHKDENKTNDCADNLEWCDRTYNNNYGTRINRAAESHKITVLQYTKDGKFLKKWDSAKDAEKVLGISDGNIWLCCNKKRKTAGGYIWRYEGRGAI